jgi:DNA-dependent RNA polymerase auxiliary subunit epsilon
MKHILAVDPGKATGMALFSVEQGQEPVMLWSGEYQQDEYAKPIRETLSLYPEAEVVCERFTINMQTVKNSQAPYSLEQIGILKQCLMDAGRKADDIYFQSPADAKAMFDNPKLKKLEYWHRGGEGHALDAIRHGLLRCVKVGWKPLRLLQ